jgi:hypothetical protein
MTYSPSAIEAGLSVKSPGRPQVLQPSRGTSLSLSADVHLNVLDNSYDRMYILARSVETGT